MYLVTATNGPGFTSLEDAPPLLQKAVHPTFERIAKLQAEGKILAAGLPVGARELVLVLDVASHEEADKLLQSLPMWGTIDWQVVLMQSCSERHAQERAILG